MQAITIKGCQKRVSRLIKGSDYFFLKDYSLASQNLDAYLQLGGCTIDTAHVYCGGESEQVIGKYMQEKNNREQITLLTKGGIPNKAGSRLHKEAVTEELFISLERLQTTYIDLYALHRDDTSLPVGYILEYLNEHLEAGRIHAIGASNWTTARLEEANDYAAKHGLAGFSFSSPNLSLAKAKDEFWRGVVTVQAEDEDWYKKHQLPLLSWSPLARGFFTGLYSPEQLDSEDMVRVYYSADNWERYERAKQLAKQKQVQPIEIALAYVLNQPYPSCAIIGARSMEELKSCLSASTINLTAEEMTFLSLSD